MENSIMDKEKKKELIQIIMRQTDYTEEVARKKLVENNFDTIIVIKKYMGLNDKKPETIKSVNQEIYKQLRYKLNNNN
jgi:hypothetical protein